MDFWVLFIVFIGIGLIYWAVTYYLEQRRAEAFENFSYTHGYDYERTDESTFNLLSGRDIRIFEQGYSQKVRHVFGSSGRFGPLKVFELQFTTGSGKSRKVHHHHVVMAEGDQLPNVRFSVVKETMWMNFKPMLGFQDKDINFDTYPEFSKRYFLTGQDETLIRKTFDDDVIRWFEGLRDDYSADLIQEGIIISKKGKLKEEHIDELTRRAEELIGLLAESSKASAYDW